jgi:hypothetical protein
MDVSHFFAPLDLHWDAQINLQNNFIQHGPFFSGVEYSQYPLMDMQNISWAII